MNKTVFDVIKEYENIENRSTVLNRGNVENKPYTRFELKIKRFLRGY